jgi:uracil-DNA glycosylase
MSILNQILPKEWANLITEQENELLKIGTYIAERRTQCNVFPKSEEVFRAFWECPLDKVRVIMLSMDPYPNLYKGEPVACGLSFAPRNPSYVPPSLRIISRCIQEDLGEGELDWQNLPKEGVLLLNAALTVEEKSPGSHLKLWENFTLGVIKALQQYNTGLIFVLLGKDAQKFKPAINSSFNYVLERPHPVSEVYSGTKWQHNNLWSEINNITKGLNGETVQWLKPVEG